MGLACGRLEQTMTTQPGQRPCGRTRTSILNSRHSSLETVSFDDSENEARISDFRSRFRKRLNDRVDLAAVTELLLAAAAGRWDLLLRDIYNAFYCCIASSQHAYRWATVLVVRVAQPEWIVDLPAELVAPWVHPGIQIGRMTA
jgi:hypothetical protein